jgi:Tfp pilus assembly protein PilN
MGQFDLNLSTRPFKPYRAINLGLLVLLLILGAISSVQISSYQQYASLAAESRAVEKQAREDSDLLNRQLEKLNKELSTGNAPMKLAEIEQLNQLILKKSFSWTRVFAHLERVTPENVRLVNLRPFVDEKTNRTGLTMEIRGRSLADATLFLRTLEQSQVFTDVILATEEERPGETAFSLSSFYSEPEKPKAAPEKPKAPAPEKPKVATPEKTKAAAK